MMSYLPDFIWKKFVGLSGPVPCYSSVFNTVFFLLFILVSTVKVNAQTDFAPGEIMFTGYNSDDPDGFSIVILADVVAGTTIYITDRGWSSITGFRDDIDGGEGTISFTFTEAYSCGTSLVFEDVGGTNDWVAEDANGNSVGTVAILTSTTESPIQDVDGIELNGGFPDGDQLFIYQLPEPNPANQSGFVTGIHMNGGAWNGGNGDDQSSQKPSGLANNQVVRFNTEVDNAKYNCSIISGSGAEIQAAIENDNGIGGLISDNVNNWTESNAYINLFPTCSFCCGAVPAIPVLSSLNEVLTNQVFTITVTGTLAPGESWELYTAGCGVGSPLQTTMSNSFTVTAPGTAGSITYYVRSSEDLTCPATCASISVCVVTDLYSTCTQCTASLTTCGPCFLPSPATNPPLDSGCYQTRLIFVLDESGSIGGNAQDVEDGVLAFLNTLNGQDIEAALIEFSDLGRLVNNYTTINDAYINNISNYFNGIPYNGQTYSPLGGTNWHDAMLDVDALDPADIVLFFTDGEPTGWTNNGNVDYCGDGTSTQTPEIVNPVKLANKIKSEGAHMFMLGVGTGIVELNLQRMSGFVEYQPGINTIGTSDYSIGDFATLAEDLEEFVEDLCRTTIEISKTILGPACNGVVDFMFIIKNTGTESSTLGVTVSDTFPSGYTNITYNGPPGFKLCPFLNPCIPAQPPNAFVWLVFPIPPQGSDTLILSATVLPTGNYTNIAWAQTDNAETVSDTFPGDMITENQPPVITCPSDVTIECTASTLPSNTGSPVASDPDGTTPVVTYTDAIVNGTCPQISVIMRTWTASDQCENAATCTQTIVRVDTTPPVITCPANASVPCQSNTAPEVLGFASAVDACDMSVTISYSDLTEPGVCAAEYTIYRTWTATDDCGNSSTCVQTISVEDTSPPALICKNISVSCSQDISPETVGYPAATNDCGGTSTFTYSDVFVFMSTPPLCSVERTWVATDDCGNSSTCLQTITLIDDSPPSVVCPASITISCSDNTLPGSTGTATSTDNCAIAPTVAYSDAITPSGTCIQNYTIARTWTATDECGNTASCTQTITVVDDIAPDITCPSNVTIACTENTLPSSTGAGTALDNCDLSPMVSYLDATVSGSCEQEYTINRTWTATDVCGNSTTCLQVITIDDIIAPAFTCPADITIACTENTLPENTGSPTQLTDNCDPAPLVTNSDLTIAGTCAFSYSITRTWTAEDACGNTTTCSQIITIQDTSPPSITCPDNITIECTSVTLPENTGTAVATDNCDLTPDVAYSDVTIAGPTQNGYTINRTWTATDVCNNSSTCLQTIIVENPVNPEITGSATDTICSGSTVTFLAEDQGLSNTTYQWMFGSGASPSSATGIGPHSVAYTYNATNGSIGAHVVLTVTVGGCSAVTDTVANVHVNAVPNPAINGSTSNLCYFRLRSFKPVAPEMPGFEYHWNFGAGASIPMITGYGPHEVEYSTTGPKTVQLIVVANEAGALCSDTATITFNVINCPGNITGRVRKPDGVGIGGVNLRLFNDTNLDGISDGGPPLRSVFTTTAGVYSMVGLVPGQYVIVETDLPGYFSLYDEDETNDFDTIVFSDPNDNVIPVTLEAQEIDADNVFVDVTNPGTITGYVFEDFDIDGMPDAGEGIAGVTVQLYPDADQNGAADPGSPLATTTTSSIGWYTFGDLANGDYVIIETQPSGYNNVQDIDLSNDGDVVPNTNMTDDIIPVTITTAETDAHNFFKESNVCSNSVTNANDDGPGSFRYALNCSSPGDTIVFNANLAGQVIHLTSDRIVVDKNIYVHSTLTPRISFQSDIAGAFLINSGITAEFKNITFISGLSGYLGAAFENYGNLILWDAHVQRNPLLLPGNFLIYNGAAGLITAKGELQIEID